MSSEWNDFSFVVQMPHMAPGEKLSEVEFLKLLAAYQWAGIAHMLGRKPSQITNDARERLYGSVIDVETKLADSHSMEILGEDAEIRVRNRVTSYAKKFVEGLFVIDDHDIPDSLLATVKTRDDLRSLPVSWTCMTNAFIAPTGSNTRLKVYKPAGIDERNLEEMTAPPEGVAKPKAPPLDARILQRVEMTAGGYVLEELSLQTLPDRRVHAWMAVPKKRNEKVGGVLALHGHGGTGSQIVRGESLYWYGRALAEMGYVVISPDIGQHELQHTNWTLMGERVWDALRCVDYLETRPEVDKKRIAVAGLSLGGETANVCRRVGPADQSRVQQWLADDD